MHDDAQTDFVLRLLKSDFFINRLQKLGHLCRIVVLYLILWGLLLNINFTKVFLINF